MSRKLRKGQSILEYTLLLGAVIAAIVTALLTKDTGIKDKVQATYDKAGTTIGNVTTAMDKGIFGM